ncbi:MAG: twin transmembrane helix small protein [Rhodospirillaceae bacterium]|nr:MAG: twin transmembrane helix small protein [Rhodospirillaceae bacterium]
MQSILSVLVIVALAAVLIVLGTGLVGFVVGGEFNRKYGNKLMRLRVATQAVAILILLASLFLRHLTH